MTEERFFSGYCRAADHSRMVELEFEITGKHRELTDADCAFPDCPHGTVCEIARRIRTFLATGQDE